MEELPQAVKRYAYRHYLDHLGQLTPEEQKQFTGGIPKGLFHLPEPEFLKTIDALQPTQSIKDINREVADKTTPANPSKFPNIHIGPKLWVSALTAAILIVGIFVVAGLLEKPDVVAESSASPNEMQHLGLDRGETIAFDEGEAHAQLKKVKPEDEDGSGPMSQASKQIQAINDGSQSRLLKEPPPLSPQTAKPEQMGAAPMIGASVNLTTHLPWGVPKAVQLISRTAYVAGFDPSVRMSRWAAYRLLPGGKAKRPGSPVYDPQIADALQLSTKIHDSLPFERGSLVNFMHISGHDQLAVKESIYYSVIAPQTSRLNQSALKKLDDQALNIHASNRDVWVITGPIFNDAANRQEGVLVPSHYFYLMVMKDDKGDLNVPAFLLPNSENFETDDLMRYLVSVDRIEALSGLDFFSSLPVTSQQTLEATPATSIW